MSWVMGTTCGGEVALLAPTMRPLAVTYGRKQLDRVLGG
jgi:hypothetical protein